MEFFVLEILDLLFSRSLMIFAVYSKHLHALKEQPFDLLFYLTAQSLGHLGFRRRF